MVCIDGLNIKSTNWYLNLKTEELEQHIQTVISEIIQHESDVNLDYTYSIMEIGSPDHGQLIDSQLSEDVYSIYRHAQIISEASSFISNRECRVYIHYKYQ